MRNSRESSLKKEIVKEMDKKEDKKISIINLHNTFLFQAGLSTIPHNLPLQITFIGPLPSLSTLNMLIYSW